jgi:periplasmic copper chaperone A
MKTPLALAAGLLLLTSAAAVQAAPADACLPRFDGGWVRLPPNAAMGMAAGFGRFSNGCAAAAEVVAVRSDAYADVSVHESVQVDGVNRMRELETLALAPGKDVELRPGGLHLMLMAPRQGLKPGDRVALTFVLGDGRSVPATLDVRAATP